MIREIQKNVRHKAFHHTRSSFLIKNCIRMIGVATALMLASRVVYSSCQINRNYPIGLYTLSAGNINLNIDPNLQIGQQIGDVRTFPMPEWSDSDGLTRYTAVQCDAGSIEQFIGTTIYDPVTQTYNLPNIEGVGYQLLYPANPSSGTQVPANQLAPFTIPNPHTPGNMVYPPASQGRPLTLRFVKTGDIKGGTAPMQKYASGGVISPIAFEALSLSFSVTAQEPTCNIDNSDIRVPMTTSDVSEFSGIGSSPSGKRKQFDIRMTCNSSVSKLSINFTSPYLHSGMPGTIDIQDEGTNTAAGVGIRIRYGSNDQPVAFGENLDITSNLASGSLSMSAEYVQTSDTVKAGIANSVATFDIEYR
ncbi:fimbrial protein [Burkholderia cepacia]|uniref:fimbrial protein n=1 Tax=Burkholderia cepacia TaxID=292 RepID=UPI0035273C43